MKNISFAPIERTKIISDSLNSYGKHLSQLHHDFLALNSFNGYFETENYYFYTAMLCGVTEVRFWKKSKRVSTSYNFTFIPKHPKCYGDWSIANRGNLLSAYNFKTEYFINPLFPDWETLKAKIDSL